MPVPVIRVKAVGKTYHREQMAPRRHPVVALDGVDLQIECGRTVGLAGGSGSGKTTLARAIAGLEGVDSGAIFLDGQDITSPDGGEHHRHQRQIQLISRESATAMHPHLSALDVIAARMVVEQAGTPSELRHRAARVMEEVGLGADRLDSRLREFSDVDRLRLAIARALAENPRVLILDDTLSGLDPQTRRGLVARLLDLQADHALAYLCVSDDLELLAELGADVIVLHEGRVVELGAAEQLQYWPRRVHAPVRIPAPTAPLAASAP